jgi:hypothetical protein
MGTECQKPKQLVSYELSCIWEFVQFSSSKKRLFNVSVNLTVNVT